MVDLFHEAQKSLIDNLLEALCLHPELLTQLTFCSLRLKEIENGGMTMMQQECQSWYDHHESVHHRIACHDASVWTTPGLVRLVTSNTAEVTTPLAPSIWRFFLHDEPSLESLWDHLKWMSQWSGLHSTFHSNPIFGEAIERLINRRRELNSIDDEVRQEVFRLATQGHHLSPSHLNDMLFFHRCFPLSLHGPSRVPYSLLEGRRRRLENRDKAKKDE